MRKGGRNGYMALPLLAAGVILLLAMTAVLSTFNLNLQALRRHREIVRIHGVLEEVAGGAALPEDCGVSVRIRREGSLEIVYYGLSGQEGEGANRIEFRPAVEDE